MPVSDDHSPEDQEETSGKPALPGEGRDGRRLAVLAESLYVLNLLLLPVIAFIILLYLFLRHRRSAPPLARNHLEQTVGASLWLGVTPTRFAKLRSKALQGALDALAPRPVGRPPTVCEDREGEACRALQKALERSERKRRVLQDLLDQGLRGPAGREKDRGGMTRRGRKPVTRE